MADEDAIHEIEQAKAALDDARVLREGGGTTAGVVNRLYYSVFHAAQAALYTRSKTPSSHGRVRQQFGQHLVLDGDATRAEGQLLGTLYDYRREADYGGGDPDADVTDLVTAVSDFVAHMDEIVTRNQN